MRYLRRFNEAVIEDKYLTPNAISDIRKIPVPEGF